MQYPHLPCHPDSNSVQFPDQDFRRVFESLPGLYLILNPDLMIITASNAYLKATLQTRQNIVGRYVFEVFPDNPADPDSHGVRNLKASLERVIRDKKPNVMPLQKYDVRNPDGTFEERHWNPTNSPVLDDRGHLLYIVHQVEDVTAFIRSRCQDRKANEELQIRNDDLEAALFRKMSFLK